MNKKYLKSKMALFGDTIESLSKHVGVSTSRFSAKMNGYAGAEFTQKEIDSIKLKYNLTPNEVCEIFFTHTVS